MNEKKNRTRGGALMLIKVTKSSIDPNEALAVVRSPSCGAVACFEGNIRSKNEGRDVIGLEYEVYEKLFVSEVSRIFSEAKNRFGVHGLALIQRIGRLDVGETGVFLAVSSPHRREALEACSYTIEEFKKRAPVWKKEYHSSGEDWVHCNHDADAD
jgi:molybdopterin synthase catalytic subunit